MAGVGVGWIDTGRQPIRNNVVSAPDAAGADHLITPPAATSPAFGESRLAMIEAHPDMCIEMRDQ